MPSPFCVESKKKYEAHHKVRIKSMMPLLHRSNCQRYISDRFLPDKAIDLMDEAAAKLRLEINSKPEELERVERRLMQLQPLKEPPLNARATPQKSNRLAKKSAN